MSNDHKGIPFWLIRGGTSRGIFLYRSDLPRERNALAAQLIKIIGAGHPLTIDGLGGGTPVTTKVAMLSQSAQEPYVIEYFFAQVGVETETVDFQPTCGNILAAVGPAAIEMGLLQAAHPTTEVPILAVNTGARVTATVQTPNGCVNYRGDTAIHGVNGCAAPIDLMFQNIVGSVSGTMFPTGNSIDTIDGYRVTCADVAMPMVIARADAFTDEFGVTGYESAPELDAHRAFFACIERIRIQAGERMGFGDVSGSVVPKFALLAPPRTEQGALTARYFMPWKTHTAMAVTGAQCLSAVALSPRTIARGVATIPQGIDSPAVVVLEHPSGTINVVVRFAFRDSADFTVDSAGLVRTARKIANGHVFLP